MAASHTLPHPPAIPQISKHGVLCLWGFGVRLQVQNGQLSAQWGIGQERYSASFPRVNRTLKRIIIICSDGFATFASMRWIADVGASLIFLDKRGKLLFVSGPTSPSDSKLRRAQSLALGNGAALRISKELISQKLDGQAALVRDMLRNSEAADAILRFKAALAETNSIEAVRMIEALAAKTYWSQWAGVAIRWPQKDERRVPAHWKRFGSRISPITHSPRLAVNPPNACMNLIHALCESECRLALIAMGLDPDIGLLHCDAPSRSSFANDLQEILRPKVDSFVLNWMQTEVFRKTDFWEDRNGNCRIGTLLAVKLCETSQVWYRLVAPIAEYISQELWNSIHRATPCKRAIPTRLTQSTKRAVKGSEVPAVAMPKYEHLCPDCGDPAPHGQHCQKCGRALASKKMTELAKAGRIAAQGADAQRRRSETQLRHKAAQKQWRLTPKNTPISEEFYCETIQPRLASVPLSEIASELEISIPYAADIRAGRRIPHPRHWQTLAKSAGIRQ